MRRLWSSDLGLAAIVQPIAAQQQPHHCERQPGLGVAHYAVGITLTEASDDIQGETTVTARFKQDGLEGRGARSDVWTLIEAKFDSR